MDKLINKQGGLIMGFKDELKEELKVKKPVQPEEVKRRRSVGRKTGSWSLLQNK